MWTWVAETVAGQPLGELTEARERKVTFDLHGPATATFALDGRSPQALALTELQTDLFLWRGRERLFRGRIGSTDDDVEVDRHQTSWSAVDYRGLFDARIVEQAQTYEQWNQDDIAWDLLSRVGHCAQDGITRGNQRALGSVRTVIVEADAKIGDTIDTFSSYWQGFDYWIDPELQYQAATWRGVARPDFPIAYGGNATKIKRSYNTGQYANWVRVRGGKPEGAEPDDPDLYADRWVPDLATRPEGRIMRIASNSELKDQAAVNAAADQLLADSQNPPAAYTATLTPGVWHGPGTLWLGDTAPVIVRSGRLDIATTGRVAQLAIAADDSGEETVEITFGTVEEPLGAGIAQHDRLGPRLTRDLPLIPTDELYRRIARLERAV